MTAKDIANFLPRGMRREDAAFYVGVSPASSMKWSRTGACHSPRESASERSGTGDSLTPVLRTCRIGMTAAIGTKLFLG
jgi:hypothetical protein